MTGFFRAIRNAVLPGDSAANPTGWLARMIARTRTSSGVEIHEGNAFGVADWYKCCKVISETGAMLPLKIYKRLEPRGRSEARNHPLFFLLHDEPNERMTTFTWRIAMFLHLENWGRHASYIERNGAGQVIGIWPIRPDRFRWELIDGKLWFFVTTMAGQQVKFWQDEILYIPGMTVDGLNTISPVEMLRESLGLSKALETYAGGYFGQGPNAGGFLSSPVGLSEPAATRLKKQFEERHTGVDNAHRIAVLEEGLKFESAMIPNDVAQFLQSRAFQRSEIAGAKRVPPHKIGDLSRSTNNNIEAQQIEFLTDCMTPKFVQIAQAMNKCLLLPREKGRLFIEFDDKGFMRGDSKSRSDYFTKHFLAGSMSPNDICDAEGDNPIPGGDVYYIGSGVMRADAMTAAEAKVEAEGEEVDEGDVVTQ